MTIFLLVLPVFVDHHTHGYRINRKECEGTYFQAVLNLAVVVGEGKGAGIGKLLLTNEVEQLQKQIVSVLDPDVHLCCNSKEI